MVVFILAIDPPWSTQCMYHVGWPWHRSHENATSARRGQPPNVDWLHHRQHHEVLRALAWTSRISYNIFHTLLYVYIYIYTYTHICLHIFYDYMILYTCMIIHWYYVWWFWTSQVQGNRNIIPSSTNSDFNRINFGNPLVFGGTRCLHKPIYCMGLSVLYIYI